MINHLHVGNDEFHDSWMEVCLSDMLEKRRPTTTAKKHEEKMGKIRSGLSRILERRERR